MGYKIIKRSVLGSAVLIGAGCNVNVEKGDEKQLPNIIYILADDMGYGDVSCLNENAGFKTPHIDSLAQDGIMFTDAHSSSAVSTPTRYSILTGRYAWRSKLKNGVLWSYDTNLINPERKTVADLLSENGYNTACIGKWHLGLGWQKDSLNKIDFFAPIKNGPTELGFDYFFGITASLDIPPYLYIENDKITASIVDTIAGNTGKGFWRYGPRGNDFVHDEVLDKLTEKTEDYISQQTAEKPFFIYFPLPAPHTPILPTEKFAGKSGTNAYGDFCLQVDDVLGRVQQALREKGFDKNTLIIFTSDNGCSPMADFNELGESGHNPNYGFRGHKADIFEGGHRIPFIAAWSDQIPANTHSNEIICLSDLMATCAAIVKDTLVDNAGEDSYNILPTLQGEKIDNSIREATVHHSNNGSFSIRQGKWKLVFCPGSGGWSHPTPKEAREQNLPKVQLYDLENDIVEQNNIAEDHPEIVKELTAIMQKYIDNGRSTPGVSQNNEGETLLFPNIK